MSLIEDAESILNQRRGIDARPGASRRLARFILDMTRIRTTYEGRDGYALVDKAAWESLQAENAMLKEQLTPSGQHH